MFLAHHFLRLSLDLGVGADITVDTDMRVGLDLGAGADLGVNADTVDVDLKEDKDLAVENDDELVSEMSGGDSSSCSSNSPHIGFPASSVRGATCFLPLFFLITKKMAAPTTKSSNTIPKAIAAKSNVELPGSSLLPTCEGPVVNGLGGSIVGT